MDPLSLLISRLFWTLVVLTLNVRLERQFIRRVESQHAAVARVIGDFSSLHEYVGRHRKAEPSFA